MTTTQSATGTARAQSATSGPKSKGELIVAALVAVMGTLLLVGTATMEVPGTSGYLGPQFFPLVVGLLLLALSALLLVQHLRGVPAHKAGDQQEASGDENGGQAEANGAPSIDWKPLGIVVATLVLFVLLLEPLGWLIAGAGLFFGVSYALGGRRVLHDIGISFVLSSTAQLGFSTGLGVALPAGILGGVM